MEIESISAKFNRYKVLIFTFGIMICVFISACNYKQNRNNHKSIIETNRISILLNEHREAGCVLVAHDISIVYEPSKSEDQDWVKNERNVSLLKDSISHYLIASPALPTNSGDQLCAFINAYITSRYDGVILVKSIGISSKDWGSKTNHHFEPTH